MRKIVLSSSLLIICVTFFTIHTFFLSDKNDQSFFQFGNLFLDGKEYSKTSEVIVIPHNRKVTINVPYNRCWDSIVSESAGETWHGVFTKNRKITLSSFCMAQYPVTQELFTKVMGFNPCYFKKENLNITYTHVVDNENTDLRPADTVSWFDTIVFCNRLTILTMTTSDCVYYVNAQCSKIYTQEDAKKGIIPFFSRKKKGYRLPTENEWEFSARGGKPAASFWSYAFSGTESEKGRIVYDTNNYSFIDSNLDSYGWYRGNSNGVTHEVGTKLPNALGIYDMSGGIWEWLYDWYDNTMYPGDFKDPYGPLNGTDRVLRGGSWYEDAYMCCVTRRFHNAHPYIPHFYFGFRYCRSL